MGAVLSKGGFDFESGFFVIKDSKSRITPYSHGLAGDMRALGQSLVARHGDL
jgi:hypothetical protein